MTKFDEPGYGISAVERDTGLSKDVLRMWERRYGFPVPARSPNGDRVYSSEQVERLRRIKRLMDLGHRPGRLIAASDEALAGLAARRQGPAPAPGPAGNAVALSDIDELLELIRGQDAAGFSQAMQQRLVRHGLHSFVLDTLAPLVRRVGDYWEDGRLAIYEEHLFSELVERLLRQAIGALPAGAGKPRVLLTGVADEAHGLGLLMVEALLTLEGAECLPLGVQTPVVEIVRAAAAHEADIVALSFAASFPARQVPEIVHQLQAGLPAGTEIWAGGAGAARLAPARGLRIFRELAPALDALRDWRAAHD